MTYSSSTDVLICGAGAAGLVLAIELARRGISFRLVEKLDVPFAGSRGKGIKPRTQEIFEDLGIINRVVALGGTYPPDRAYSSDGTYCDAFATEPKAPTAEEPYHIPLMVPQFLTEGALRDRLAELGAQVEFGRELRSFSQDAHGVTAQVAGPDGEETVRARYLVGADGGRSAVRHALAIGFPGKTLGVRAIVADVHLQGVSNEAWHRWGDGDMQRQIFLCPLRGTDLFQVQGPVPLEGDVDLSAAGLTRLITERSGRPDIVVHDVQWASAFHMNARLADTYQVGRVFLCGDAAHIHPPTGGQGLNTSIQDAYNLGWKLAAVIGGAPDRLLDTYEAERRPIAADMLGLTTHLLQALKERCDMRRGREGQQLDLCYAGSALGLNAPDRSPNLIGAGDRAPDAPLQGAAGQRVRAFELYRGTHWTLLAYETDDAPAPAARKHLHVHRIGQDAELVDPDDAFRVAYGVQAGDWVLVRPDGYVGALVSSRHRSDLQCYLANVGLGR